MNSQDSRLRPPLMYLFREAARAHDSRKPLDLRDAEGARIITSRRALTRQPVSEDVLRKEVERNLVDLLNATALGATEDLAGFEEAERSILNYGIVDLASITIDETRLGDVAESIRKAVIAYEPRLAPESVSVRRDDSVSPVGLEVRFIVSGDLLLEPLNVPVSFVAEIERDAARFRVTGLV